MDRFTDLFEAWTAQAPVVLAMEDLQWADELSIETIDFLRVRLEAHPFAVVATARPEVHAERRDALPGAQAIALRELTVRETAEIVERILEPAPAPPGTPASETIAARIVERAAGNPFFAEELALAVREGADPDALPFTVEGAVQSRLDRLPFREKDLLKRASVLGRRFWTEALDALGEPDAPPLLASLRRRDLVVPRAEPRLAGCAEWLVRQAVVHEVAYGMLTASQRRSLHRAAAVWLGARPDALPEEVAGHFEEAGDPAAARPLWIRAAHAADAACASEKVLAFSDRALAGPPGKPLDPGEEHALRVVRAEACRWLGRLVEEEREHLAIAAVEARAAGGAAVDPAALARERFGWSGWLVRRGRIDEARAAAAEAVSLAARAGDAAWTARARAALAQRLAHTGRLANAEREAEAAVTVAAGDAAAHGFALVARGFVHALAGRPAQALADYRAARLLQESAGLVRQAAQALMNQGSVLTSLGAVQSARVALEESLAAARTLGLRFVESWTLCNLGLVLAHAGDAPAGVAAVENALAIARSTRDGTLPAVCAMHLAWIRRDQGELAAALADADAAVAGSVVRPQMEALSRTVRAAVLLDLGRLDEALAEADRALAARDAAGGMETMEVDLLLVRHDALAALARHEEARAALEVARVRFDALLARLGDPDDRRTFSENLPAHRRVLRLTSGSP